MTDHLPMPPPDSGSQDMEAPSAAAGSSLLRLRDVQALNRSFRRLAEVQEALLRQMQELERERRRQRAWIAPLLAVGGMMGGLGLAALAFVWWRGGQPPERIQVQAPAPNVTVEPAPVTIQVPKDPALTEMADLMKAQMEGLRSDQLASRAQLADLTERLFNSEQEKIDLLKQVAVAAPEPAVAAVPPPPMVLQTPASEALADDPWVGVVNGLLSLDGYSHLRFQEATRVPGAPRLEDVVLMEWKSDGQLDGLIRADRAEFELHHMTGNLVLRFFDGYRTGGAGRIALPADGLRLDLADVNAPAWLEHFPELSDLGGVVAAPAAAGSSAEEVKEPAAAGASVREIRNALDALISQRGSFHYYKLNALGGVNGTVLQLVQINWHDNAGRLVKTIEADTMVVRLHPKGNSVELELRNGAFLSEEGKSPFSSDLFRLYLPRQDLAAWRASGVPYVEAQG